MSDGARRGRPTAAQRGERRKRMLREGLRVFLANGYQRTTIEQLALSAGVTKRTIYTDYGDKAGLFAAMVADLAGAISRDAAEDDDTLLTLSTRIVYRIHSDDLVGLHRLVIAESGQFPQLARLFYERADDRHIAALREHLLVEHGSPATELAEPLFSLLLGSAHRRRVLGITSAPTATQAAAHAKAALASIGLAEN